MKNKRLFNLSAIILGVMTLFSFSNVQATESVFSDMTPTRSSAQAYSMATFSNSTTLGISKDRESGNAYTWNPNTTGEAKTVWKIANINSSNGRDYSNLYYCLNAARGFGLTNGEMAEGATDEYLDSFDMKNTSNTDNINNIKNYAGGNLAANYNQVLWVLDNSYIPGVSSNQDKINLLSKAYEYRDYTRNFSNYLSKTLIDNNSNIDLTDEQIEVVQQLAIWHFTNGYNVTADILYQNGKEIDGLGNNYDVGGYGVYFVREGEIVAWKMEALYNYFVEAAPSSYSPVIPTLTLTNTNAKVNENENYYIVGPFELSKTDISVTDVIVKLNNTELSTSDYILTSSASSTTNITNYNNLSTFYLKINKDKVNADSTISIEAEGEYSTKTLTFLTDIEDYNNTQPVVLIKNVNDTKSTDTTAEIKLTQVVVEKVWNDNNNQDGKRPGSIVVNLLADGTKIDSKTVTADSQGKWECTFTKLLKNKDGKEVAYTVTENTVSNYTTAITGDMTNGFIITNTHIPEKIEITGTKTWVDNNNQDGKRPESIVVNLLANGEKIDSKTITAPWTYSFTNLDKYKDGVEITYTIDEEKVTDYTTTINGYDITNKYTPGKVSKTVIKTWEDNNNQDEIRPESITVKLYKLENNEKVDLDTQELNESNDWRYTWTELDEKSNGEDIVYGIEEITSIEGYVTEYSIPEHVYNDEDTITITNIHVPQNLEIVLQKVDENGDVITSSEAAFEITGQQEISAQTNQGILDLDSQKLVGNTFEFIYSIKETNAPIGYNKIEDELSVKISGTTKLEDGTYKIDTVNITDKDGNELDSTKISAQYDETLNQVVIKVTNTRKTNGYSIKLLKVSEDGTTPISGAWFKIDDGQPILVSETGEEIATGTLVEGGELNLTYKLEETTAPDGYVKIDGQKEVKINAKVELKDNEYQLTEVKLLENIDGITINEENNVITIKVENEIEVTGKYNVVLRKLDENRNILTGSKFEVNGKEYELSTGEVILLEDTDLTSTKDIELTYAIKETQAPEGYETIEDTTIYIRAKIQKQDNNYKLIRVELVDGEGNVITDENITVKVEGDSIVISVVNNPIPKKLDLSLRKFITKINDVEYFRSPVVDTSKLGTVVDGKVITTATYKHTKEPIAVQKGDVVTYTIRVYNEGEVDGYVEMITDHLPENLLPIIEGIEGIDSEKYKEEIEFNNNWLWIYSDEGKTINTTITSKSNSDTYSVLTGLDEIVDTKLDAYVQGSDKLDYIDVQIKCLVTDSAISGEYLTNIAEISKMCDADGVEFITDRDSTKANVDYSNLADYKNDEAINSTEESYVEGQEDDDDFEKLVVKEFDLSLRKFITKVNETSYSRVPVVDTSKLGTTVDGKVITTATYNHSKEPVIVETDDLVTYTIRIYNEGTLAGFANEITDDIPEGLEFMPNSSVNISYRWKMLDQDGNETEDVSKAVMIVTDYLSDIDKNNVINAVSEVDGVKTLSYKDVEVQFKVVAKAENLKDNIIINEAQISADSDRDIDSVPNRDEKYDYLSGNNEDDIDYEPIKLQYFDLALRKFITKVNLVDYNNRYPEIVYNEDGSITYNHTKDPVLVTTNDIVVYTIRIYNEGEKAGYATKIIDNLPDGLEFIPDNEINKQNGWKLIDSEGNITEELDKAVKASTDYLKDEIIDPLVEENGQKILSYKDVQIAFKVVEPNTSDRILVNTAEISEDSDDDIDSVPGNDVLTEDDIDREYVKVQYFDLSLKKWVTRTEVTYNGKTTTTKTGFTEDSDEIAKVDLVASKMTKTTVKFAYNIKVTNEGELPGYAYEVKDYIPKGLKFVAADNKDWKELEDGSIVTDKLKDTLLNPGESATVEIVLTWKNSTTNTGLKTNYAEISGDSAEDIDSTPDNYNKQEDDIDDAQVILSIKTAGPQTYVGLVFLSITILAGGIFLIKKYVI